MLKKKAFIAIAAFAAANCCLALAGFLAPYDPTEQHRELAYAPPVHLHFIDQNHQIHVRPFVYALQPANTEASQYSENERCGYPLRFLEHQADGLHLFSVSSPAQFFLLGTDGFGRDIFSRILFGGRISLTAALLATLLSLAMGTSLGAVAGYFGGMADAIVM